jgi:hypothetical protein
MDLRPLREPALSLQRGRQRRWVLSLLAKPAKSVPKQALRQFHRRCANTFAPAG